MKSAIVIVTASLLVAAVFGEQTECQRSRERQLKSSSPIIIHECKENGDYASLQSYQNSRFKICLDKDGHVTYGPSTRIQLCHCFEDRYNVIKQRLPEAEQRSKLPLCDQGGHYVSLQSDGTSHWCVNPVTGTKTTVPRPISRRIRCS